MGSPLRTARTTRGWTLDEVVDKLQQLADERGLGVLGIDANAVSRHERGVIQRPRHPYPILYAAVYETTAAELWPNSNSRRTPGGSTLDAMERRALLKLLAAAVGGLALDAGRLVGPATGAQLDRAGIDVLRAGIAHARRLDDMFGARIAVRPALAQQQLVASMLARSHGDQLDRDLRSLGGQLSQLLGWLSFDLGNQQAARAHFDEGLQAAHEAGDEPLTAYLLGYVSILAMYGRQPVEGLALAEGATAKGATARPAIRSWLLTVEAEALANLHFGARTEVALAQAEKLVPEIPDPEPVVPWLLHYDRSGFTSAAGSCYLALGDGPRARTAMQETIQLSAPHVVREEAVYLVRLGQSYVLDRDPTAAATLGSRALTIAQATSSPRAITRVRELHAQLTPWRSEPAVRELHDQLAAL